MSCWAQRLRGCYTVSHVDVYDSADQLTGSKCAVSTLLILLCLLRNQLSFAVSLLRSLLRCRRRKVCLLDVDVKSEDGRAARLLISKAEVSPRYAPFAPSPCVGSAPHAQTGLGVSHWQQWKIHRFCPAVNVSRHQAQGRTRRISHSRASCHCPTARVFIWTRESLQD